MATAPGEAPSARTRLRRNARRAEYDPRAIRGILASQKICHVAYVEDGQPRQIATLYVCDDDYLYLHGNRQAALLQHIAAGGEVSVAVTAVDGIVVARSGFHCSMNYRSVVLFGRGEALQGADHEAALGRFVARLIPGHEQVVRGNTSQELAATMVVRIPLQEMSAKVRTGDPIDDEGDLDGDVWAGVVPIRQVAGTPEPSADLKPGIAVPDYITHLQYTE